MIDFSVYKALLADRGLARPLLWSWVARLPLGMNGLALTLATKHVTGSYSSAGLVTGSFLCASALGAPFMGRWIDQRGPEGLVKAYACIHIVALLAIFALPGTASLFWFALLAGVAGLTQTPVTTLMRAMWQKSNLSDEKKRAGLSFDAMILEFAFMLGPLVVSATVALQQPRLGTVLSSVLCAIGTIGFVRSGGTKQWGQVEHKAQRHWLGPMQSKGFIWLVLACFCFAASLAMNEMVLIAFTQSIGHPSWVGWQYFMACISSGVFSLWFGTAKLKLSLVNSLALFAVYTGITMAAMALVTNFWAMLVLALLSGALVGPSIASLFALSGQLVPSRYATEAGTWLGSMILSGLGGGFALAGLVLELHTWQTLAWLSAIPVALVLFLSRGFKPASE